MLCPKQVGFQTRVILDLWGMAFHAIMVSIGLGLDFYLIPSQGTVGQGLNLQFRLFFKDISFHKPEKIIK